MKYILDLINESIQKMANKPLEEAIKAAQSIAKEMDDALANGYEIEWRCLPISKTIVDVFIVSNKTNFVCRFFNDDTWNEVSDLFCAIGDETDVSQMGVFVDLMNRINQAFER